MDFKLVKETSELFKFLDRKTNIYNYLENSAENFCNLINLRNTMIFFGTKIYLEYINSLNQGGFRSDDYI